jgi:hypothetical protein
MTDKKPKSRDRKSRDRWSKPETEEPNKRPGPFAQDPGRMPPTKEERERGYAREGRKASEGLRRKP